MLTLKIGFIGGGNMAQAIISGLLAKGYAAENIQVSDPHPEKLEELRTRFSINTTQDNHSVAKWADALVLAVKPQVAKSVLNDLAATVQQRQPLIVSVMAGVRAAKLAHWLGGLVAIVRCMPNTPAMVGAGATGLYANAQVSVPQKQNAESLMRAIGVTVWLAEEQQLDAVTALSGSGPAYFFRIMEIMETTGEALGLSKQAAHLLTLQTALGAARMALDSTEGLSTLRQRVTSPNGTTECALNVLEQGGIAQLIAQAMQAAKLRSEELAETL